MFLKEREREGWGRERETETERQRQRQTDRQTDRQRERERERRGKGERKMGEERGAGVAGTAMLTGEKFGIVFSPLELSSQRERWVGGGGGRAMNNECV